MAFHPGRDPSSLCSCGCAVLCAASLCLAAVPANALPTSGTVATAWLDTLVVTAPLAAGRPAPAVGAVVTHIDLEGERGARDLADVLGATAGLQVRRFGAAGAGAVPSLRGSAPAQLRIFVDGMPLDDAQTGLVNLARLPLERFASVDVHRGGVPVRLGGIGGSGAVNLHTRQGAAGLDLTAGGGSFGEVFGRAVWGTASADRERSVLVLVHGRRADNDFPYLDHRWTFNDPTDDVPAVRENSWIREHGAFATAKSGLGGAWRIRGWAGFLRRDGGRPGPIGDYASPNASVNYERGDGHLAVDWREGLVKAEVSGARTDERLEDPAAEVGFAPPGVTVSHSEDVMARLSWAPILIDSPALELALRLGGERRWQWHDEAFNDRADPQRHRLQTTLFGALAAGLAGGRLQVVPSLRWQENVDDFPPLPPLPWLPEQESEEHTRQDVSPALGVVWDQRPGSLAWEFHAARSVRVPTWIELFGHRGGIVGNRELQPEEISTVDLGLTVHPRPGATLRAAVFASATENTIIFLPNSQRTSRAENAGASRNRGLELELWLALPAQLQLQANATFQRPRDTSGVPAYDGKHLPYLSDREGFLRLRHDGRALAPWTEVLLQSSNYRDRYNTEQGKAPARALLNLGLDWILAAGRVTLAGAVLNLTDNSVYDVEGFPLPGRSWRASLRIRP